MSLFSWLFPLRRAHELPQLESSGLSRIDPTHPLASGERPNLAGNAQPANRKQERMVRRELLYGVVREAMARAGVRSANYKFKVLSLDGRGRQFLVMVDLSSDCGIGVPELAEVEAMVAQAAKQRHDIVVTSLYWRMNEHVAVGDPKAKAVAARPPAPGAAAPAAKVKEPEARSRFDPIGADEVEAFKRALASGMDSSAAAAAATVAQGAAAVGFDGVTHHGPQSYTLLTGYEDTEINELVERPEELSGTQYGELG